MGMENITSNVKERHEKAVTARFSGNLSFYQFSVIYFLREEGASEFDWCKIGVTRHLASRISGIQTGNPRRIVFADGIFLRAHENAYLEDVPRWESTNGREAYAIEDVERAIHKRCIADGVQYRGEWFKDDFYTLKDRAMVAVKRSFPALKCYDYQEVCRRLRLWARCEQSKSDQAWLDSRQAGGGL